MDMGKKILVIEDDADILTILKDQLELDGYDVACASSGEKGYALFKELQPDLIILDLNLPDYDGINICKKIRISSDVPIIMLTARDGLSDKIRGFEYGADDYIVKPFEYLELAARIRACLKRRQITTTPKSELVFGPLIINSAKRTVRLNGKPIRLTKKEYDLLELFTTHAGEILKREYICKQLWTDNEIYPWSRALDVHIRRLRKKIEPDPDNPRFIVTHPGVGYRFEPGE